MKAVVFDKIGHPLDVLYLADVPVPEIKDDEVLVKMIAASISPGDFLFIGNLYPEPKKPHFPRQIGGNHGVGIVERAGGNPSVKPGDLVVFSYYNSWTEYVAVPAEWLMPLPTGFPLEKGGQFFNLITAQDLVRDSQVGPGQWLALTAGHSALSMMALQFAKLRDVNVISVVSRTHERVDLKALGATEVIDLSVNSKNIGQQIMEITQNKGINGLVDNVGGPVTGELIRSIVLGGRVIINGGMSAEHFELHNFDVLLKGLEIKGHVYRYFFTPPPEGDKEFIREIAAGSGRPSFEVPIGGLHALEDFGAAVDATIRNSGRGKHLFRMLM